MNLLPYCLSQIYSYKYSLLSNCSCYFLLAQNADVLVHESTFAKDETKMAHNYYHSTSKQAAEIAKKAGVKKLLLNHISARYTGKAAYQLAYQVRNIIPDTRVVNDFDVIDIPFKK